MNLVLPVGAAHAAQEEAAAPFRWAAEGLAWVKDPRRDAPGLDGLLSWAFRLGASRIAFQTGHPVWIRVHGRNHRATEGTLNEVEIGQVANHLYGADGMARLQGGQDFDVSYEIAVSRAQRLRFRLNATPTRSSRREGANIVLRPIADLPPSLAAQLVEPGIMEAFRPERGMVIVSGGTGSGKSTLIAGMTVAKLSDHAGNYNIQEAAAPVEFLLDRFRSPSSTMAQTEIPRDLPTFEAFIRGCMRREPTDIIVGECRDSPTMAASIHAAISGHALTTTIHADDVPLTMQRITTLCPRDERDNLIASVAQSLRLVINQRLLPSTDGKRTAVREFVVFDAGLRTKLLQADPSEWPVITRHAVDRNGQSYAVGIRAALAEGRICAGTASRALREIG
ncbi:type IV pilus twitching motility protein PilT [Plastoroseomonas hellenica]|uniref:type IV pilus twitching motility protein PilT n=1 Tax=Plastoroseomonas hellenica TaxID=2687306 RepID=UPI001BAA2255|nr:ATPase, T2SS/T4P/T4SS family [Plastoroseomonas hellenica]MBR0641211.1 Flp pilus assembly complex ATPase component [Plastoroseomonas hellenica]